MIEPGLVSVTFRQLCPDEIIELVRQARLGSIAWSGDVHVPLNDPDRARRIGRRTRSAGLEVAGYGSYYRLASGDDFAPVLEAARELGAALIRVWSGERGSKDADDQHVARIVEEGRQLGQQAAGAGMTVAFEYHAGTLTETAASANALLAAIDDPRVRTLWQPPIGMPAAECERTLRAVLRPTRGRPRLSLVARPPYATSARGRGRPVEPIPGACRVHRPSPPCDAGVRP